MQSFLSSRSKLKLKIFGWYQIIGGIAGLLITIWLLAHTGQINGLVLLLILVAFGLYGFSIYCGRLLLTDNYSRGLSLSIINQALQIIHFAMLGYAYQYSSGLMFELGMGVNQGLKFNFNFALNSIWQLSIGTNDRSFTLAINLVAIYWLYFIEKLRIAIKQEQANMEELQYDDGL
jgi:uncharacterized membrane protein